MSYQKNVPTRDTFYKQTNTTNDAKYQTKGTNFLGKTYQKMYQEPTSIKSSLSKNQTVDSRSQVKKIENLQNYMAPNTNRYSSRIDSNLLNDQSYGGLYIDNFARSDVRSNLELNRFAELAIKKGKEDVVIFEDDLSNHSSASRGSAFDQS
jgi:hypothetical protein